MAPLSSTDRLAYTEALKQRRMQEACVVYSQASAAQGTLLAAANNAGRMCIWKPDAVLARHSTLDQRQQPVQSFVAHPGHRVYAMAAVESTAHRSILCSAGGADVHVRRLASEAETLYEEAPASVINVSGDTEINAMSPVDGDGAAAVYAATGDGRVLCLDVEAGSVVSEFHGHTDMVTTVATVPNSAHLLASGSEDGTVRLWDVRAGKSARILEPGVVLADHGGAGRWISAVAVDEAGSWLACGGGIPGSLWHIESGTMTSTLGDERPTGKQSQQTISEMCFTSGGIQVLGNDPVVRVWSLQGELLSATPTPAPSLFCSAVGIPGILNMTTVAGVGPLISVFTHGCKASFELQFR